MHRALRVRLAAMAAERPVVLLLDDLHWADDASLEAIAALMRRGPAAPVLLAGAFRPGQAPPLLSAALAVSTVERIELGQLGDTAALELLGGRGDAEILRHGGGNPFYLEQLARGGVALARPAGAAVGRRARRRRGVADRGAERAVRAASAPCCAARRSPASRSSPTSRPRSPASIPPTGSTRSTSWSRTTSCAPPTSRAASPSATRSSAARSTSRSPAGRAWPATRGPSRRCGPAAPPPRSCAHHVEHAAARGDETAIAQLTAAGAEAAARAPAAAARWYEAALRILPAGDPAREVELRVALAAALRSAGELERSRTDGARGDRAAARRRRRAPGGADGAVRGRRALARPPRRRARAPRARVGGAARPLRRRRGRAPGRAGGRRAVRDGPRRRRSARPRRAGHGAGGGRPGAARARRLRRLPVRGRRRQRRGRARAPRRRAGSAWTASPTPSWRRGWRRSTTWAGRRTTSSAGTTRSATSTAGSPSPAPPARAACSSR